MTGVTFESMIQIPDGFWIDRYAVTHRCVC